jgi:hypothetical protein
MLLTTSNTFAQLSTIDNTSPSITQDLSKIIDSKDLNNPLRQGSRLIVESPIDPTNNYINILSDEIQNFTQAETFTLDLIKNIINILLWFISLIVTIYLIYEWYMIVTAGTNQDQYKEALKKLKNAAIAIAGIAVSWFVVNFIFLALNTII